MGVQRGGTTTRPLHNRRLYVRLAINLNGVVRRFMVRKLENPGIIYILSNEAMPCCIKLGRTEGDSTKDVEGRMTELYTTGVPLPFKCEYAAVVENFDELEKELHGIFQDLRINPNREFFHDDALPMLKRALRRLAIKDVTPPKQMNLKQLGLPEPTGDEIRIYRRRRLNDAKETLDLLVRGLVRGHHLDYVRWIIRNRRR